MLANVLSVGNPADCIGRNISPGRNAGAFCILVRARSLPMGKPLAYVYSPLGEQKRGHFLQASASRLSHRPAAAEGPRGRFR